LPPRRLVRWARSHRWRTGELWGGDSWPLLHSFLAALKDRDILLEKCPEGLLIVLCACHCWWFGQPMEAQSLGRITDPTRVARADPCREPAVDFPAVPSTVSALSVTHSLGPRLPQSTTSTLDPVLPGGFHQYPSALQRPSGCRLRSTMARGGPSLLAASTRDCVRAPKEHFPWSTSRVARR
jgi:hypothetical protein